MRNLKQLIMTRRRLHLFKWLMVVIPPVTVTVGHWLPRHLLGHSNNMLVNTFFVTFVALVLSYVFVETLFRVLRSLQAEAIAREQDILTMNAVVHERERLSRELHDGVSQLMAHLLLRLDTVMDLVETKRVDEARAELERLHGVADEIYLDIGASIRGFRANVVERGLLCALQEYVEQFEERHHIPVRLRSDGAVEQVSPLAAFQIFRLVQEALTNVRKHSGAREVTVTLTSDCLGQFRVIIEDDGRGFTADLQRSVNGRPLGLTSMRERVQSVGGTFDVESQPGSGTRIMATIPVPQVK